MSLPKELLKKVKLLELNTRKLVNSSMAGEYHTAFKGQGMTFADFREYVPGDDIRALSWSLMARTGKPYIKTFEEERELTLYLAVDVSGSTDFGTGQFFKGEVINHVAAMLAFSAVKNQDQVGLLLMSDQVEHFVPAKKGRGHVYRILRDLYFVKPKSHRTRLSVGLGHLQGVLKKRAVIFVMSDFIDKDYEQALRRLGKKHDVVACVIQDPSEYSLPQLGLVDLQDPETGETVTIDTSDPAIRAAYVAERKALHHKRDRELIRAQVDRIDLNTGEDFTKPLIEFLHRRRS